MSYAMKPIDDMQEMSITFLHAGQLIGLEGSFAHSSSGMSSLGASAVWMAWFSTSVSPEYGASLGVVVPVEVLSSAFSAGTSVPGVEGIFHLLLWFDDVGGLGCT